MPCQAPLEEQLWPEAQRWMRCPEAEVMDIPGPNPALEAPVGVGGVKETSSAQGSTSTSHMEHGEQEGRGQQRRALTNAGERTLPDQRHGEGRGRGQLLLLIRLGEPADCVGVAPLLGLLLGVELVPGEPQTGTVRSTSTVQLLPTALQPSFPCSGVLPWKAPPFSPQHHPKVIWALLPQPLLGQRVPVAVGTGREGKISDIPAQTREGTMGI